MFEALLDLTLVEYPQEKFPVTYGSGKGALATVGGVTILEVGGVVLEPLIGIYLVEAHAGLEDVDECVPLVRDRPFDHFLRLVDMLAVGPRDKCGAQRDSYSERIERLLHNAFHLHRRPESGLAGR